MVETSPTTNDLNSELFEREVAAISDTLREALLDISFPATPTIKRFKSAIEYRRKYDIILPHSENPNNPLAIYIAGAVKEYGLLPTINIANSPGEEEIDLKFLSEYRDGVNAVSRDPKIVQSFSSVLINQGIAVGNLNRDLMRVECTKALDNYSARSKFSTTPEAW